MHTRSKKLAAAAGLCAALTTGAARADVVYSFTGTAAGQLQPAVFSLDLTDAQVASGSFMLSGIGGGRAGTPVPGQAPVYTGDTAGFVSATLTSDTISPTFLAGGIQANLTFGPADSLAGIDINYTGYDATAIITGTGSDSTIAYGNDDPQICNTSGNSCTITNAAWTVTVTDPTGSAPGSSSVPEPTTVAVLTAGLLGLAGLRQRRATYFTGKA